MLFSKRFLEVYIWVKNVLRISNFGHVHMLDVKLVASWNVDMRQIIEQELLTLDVGLQIGNCLADIEVLVAVAVAKVLALDSLAALKLVVSNNVRYSNDLNVFLRATLRGVTIRD